MIEKLNLDNEGLPENEAAIERKFNELIEVVNKLEEVCEKNFDYLFKNIK